MDARREQIEATKQTTARRLLAAAILLVPVVALVIAATVTPGWLIVENSNSSIAANIWYLRVCEESKCETHFLSIVGITPAGEIWLGYLI